MIRDIVILREQPDNDSFIKFVRELGGHWVTATTTQPFEFGVVEKWRILVILELSEINKMGLDYQESELEWLEKYLGVPPAKVINLDVRKNNRSINFAQQIEKRILEIWGGYVDRESDQKILG